MQRFQVQIIIKMNWDHGSITMCPTALSWWSSHLLLVHLKTTFKDNSCMTVTVKNHCTRASGEISISVVLVNIPKKSKIYIINLFVSDCEIEYEATNFRCLNLKNQPAGIWVYEPQITDTLRTVLCVCVRVCSVDWWKEIINTFIPAGILFQPIHIAHCSVHLCR